MKKVMLVDDEILFRESIRDCINWEAEGFLYCGDASDGEMALPLVEQLQPDILITDIMMPFMNGLELCSIVRSQLPDTKIIILSGYGEFEYARSAIRMGVEDYCLKPVSPGELIRLLHEVSHKIDQERDSRANIEKLKQQDNQRMALTKEKLLSDLCSGFVTASEAIHWGSTLQLNLIARFYVVVIINRRDADDSGFSNKLVDHPNVQKCFEAYNRLKANGQLQFQHNKTENVWIIKSDTLEQLNEELSEFKVLQQLIHDTKYSNNVGLSVGIGSVQNRMNNVHLSFLDAAEDMYWRRLSTQNRLSLFETNENMPDPGVFLERSKFIDFLKIGDQTKLSSFIQSLCAPLHRVDWKASPIGRYILNDATLEAFRSAQDMYRHIANPEDALRQYQQQIGKISSMQEACDYLISLVEQFWSWRSQLYDKYGHLLHKVKEYIHAQFSDHTLSLQNVAQYVNVSPSHLSKIFSQETGQTFIEYLTQVRIRKAIELLLTTPAKSYEIAYQVGYNDPHYFSSLFKRVTGKTTTEFRKNGTVHYPKTES
ncbi:response regulator transcription factor [Paenibacillus xylaniclasticus]|uniref:response regulator transcription factor n=1 Tax=Paenibacillus xylaniclasticus TaxID=588083 RepID=UPI000FDC0D9A|nr:MULTISPECIES: response regulator [Paenibacillus]GFN30461.1 hypothetical protein PCURB6_07210 [Paenibacillus curdlanolyticus]